MVTKVNVALAAVVADVVHHQQVVEEAIAEHHAQAAVHVQLVAAEHVVLAVVLVMVLHNVALELVHLVAKANITTIQKDEYHISM